jgi:hypothetical protein
MDRIKTEERKRENVEEGKSKQMKLLFIPFPPLPFSLSSS